jgi:hypothetical protein
MQVIIMALASTINTPVPSGKELVFLCMDYRYYENEDALNITKVKLGENMIWVGCPNCKSGTFYMYSTDFPVKCGFTNPCNHFVQCVGNNNNMMKIVHARLHTKQLQKEQDERSKAVSNSALQQTLSTYNFLLSKAFLSIHMWITKIVIKNTPIYDIECEVEREMVCFPQVKSVKTVLDRSHLLVAIIEEKISKMMKTAPAGQIFFYGYTVGGQYYVAVFALFMLKCTSIAEWSEFKYDKHELHLLACAPLPPVSLDVGDEEEESTEFIADAHVNYFQKTFKLYGIDYDGWVLCQCADSAAVNPKISRETHCRHISCKSHNLALAGKVMLEEDGKLQDLITKVFAYGVHVWNLCKVSTGLRNKAAAVDPKLTNVSTKSESETCQWLGAAINMKQHI